MRAFALRRVREVARMKVTPDAGGIVAMAHASGSMYYATTRAVGQVQMSSLDETFPPCRGWVQPLQSLSVDGTTGSIYAVPRKGGAGRGGGGG